MKSQSLALGSLLVWSWCATGHAEDWGLTRERPGAPARARAKRPAPPVERGGKPRAPAATGSQVEAKPAIDAVATQRARALQLLLADFDQPALRERLFTLYRERDGHLDGLAAELVALPQPGSNALCLLGLVEQARGKPDAARAAFERAIEGAPRALPPHLALAELERGAGAHAAAQARLEAALPLAASKQARTAVLRALAENALDRESWQDAEQRYRQLAALLGGSSLARTEQPRALQARGLHARAAEAYERLTRELADDPRVLPPLWLEQARAELLAGRPAHALPLLERLRTARATEPGVRAGADALLLEVHRSQGSLPQLVEQLAAARNPGVDAERLLGRLYDELGDHGRALAVYRRVLGRSAGDVETRERVVELLASRGELREALEEQRVLVRLSPREPRHVIGLAKALLEAARRPEALALLDATGRRYARDGRIQRALLEVYTRWDEPERAARTLAALGRIEPDDPAHVIALAEQRLEQGDEAGALAIFRRLLELGLPPAEAHAQLADALLDHDMAERALAEYETAVRAKPDAPGALRGLAETLERLGRPGDAAKRWQEVLALTEDRALRREARRRIVRLWSSAGELSRKRAELERAFWHASGAPDLEAGRFLAECYHVLATGGRRVVGEAAQLNASERVLERLVELAPGDVESLLSLERLHVGRGRLQPAIDVLGRLLEADPQRARGYLSRMADHALAAYRDQDALAFAERALALDPSDARAQERVGDLHRARQNVGPAIAAYERTLALDPDAHAVALRLAELHVAGGKLERATETLMRVLRTCPDDELVRQAARNLLPIAQRTQGLSGMEQALSSLALGHAARPVFRALLIELYGALAQPLVEAARAEGADGDAARKQLLALSSRAQKPLLEALSEPEAFQRVQAVELLRMLGSPHAAPALLRVAEQDGDTALRRNALLAAAAHPDGSLAERFAALASAQERRLRDAATWGLARIDDRAAWAQLRALLASNTEGVRMYAALGLGRARDRTALPALRALLVSDRDALVRGSAALALALADDRDSSSALVATLRSEQGEAAIAAALALGHVGGAGAIESLCDALFWSEPPLRAAALWSLRALAAGAAPAPPELPAPVERAGLAPLLAAFVERAPAASAAAAVARFREPLAQATSAALTGPPPQAHVALQLLSGAEAGLGLPAALLRRELLPALREPLAKLQRHGDGAIRAAALALLAGDEGARVAAQLGDALLDGDPRVQAAALEAIVAAPAHGTADALVAQRVALLARKDPRFWLRRKALAALRRVLGAHAVPTLVDSLRSDAYAYVREQAVECLGELGGAAAESALRELGLHDSEPRVRAAAERALGRLHAATH